MSQTNFDIDVAVQMAHSLYQSKKYHECIDICIQILGVDCTKADVWNLAGIVMLELNIHKRSIEYFTQAIRCEPMQLSYKLNLAEAHRRSGQPKECIAQLEALLSTSSEAKDSSHLHFNLAKAYSDLEDSDNSIKHYSIAVKLDPTDLGAMFNLANAQVSLKHFGEAIELYLYALSKGYIDAGVNLANTYVQIGLFGEAIQVYSAIYKHYKDDSDFLFNYANALHYAKSNEHDIQAMYERAISINPKSEYFINYAHYLLQSLRFEEGFRIYEERKKFPQMLPDKLELIWHYGDSTNFRNKNVLIYHEQGLGDSIMFARFIPLLKKKAKSISAIVQDPLMPLFEKMRICNVVDARQMGRYDVAISLLSLPLALGVSSVTDLDSTPFMLESKKVNKDIKKIGICFSTDSKFSEASIKSIPLEILMEALVEHINDIEIYSLNKPKCEIIGNYEIIQKELNNFVDTYEIIRDMDIVISIDSAVAHLSASMGKPTLVLLNKRYDWRWGNGVTTPWYKDAVCFTQSKMQDWSDVMQNLVAYIKGWKYL